MYTALFALRPLLIWLIRSASDWCFSRTETRALVRTAYAEYRIQLPQIPREPSFNGRLMVHFAALTIGLYRALLARSMAPEEAREHTARATGAVYQKMAAVPGVLSRVLSRDPYLRLKRATDLFRRFPFNPPAYEMVDVAAEPGTVAFDVLRCPVAEYFCSHDLGELCQASFCDLDYPLARKWGGFLERPNTIASGAERCDFRWKVS